MVVTAHNTHSKSGYKQTEVGLIPEDWEVKTLEELGSWRGGATPSMANTHFWLNGTIFWASSGDVKTKLLSNTANMITEVAVKLSSTTLLKEGAILIVTRSGILRKYLPVAKNTVSIAINQDIKALIPNSQVNADYLLQLLSERGPDILSTCMKSGTTVESIEYPWLKKYSIPLPPLLEQQAIATALSDVDALIASLDQLIAKKRDIKQAMMQQLLTGKVRLPGFSEEIEQKYKQTELGLIPEDWDIKTVEDIADVKGGKRLPAGRTLLDKPTPYPYIRVTDMFYGGVSLDAIKYVPIDVFPEIKNYRIFTDDIFITVAGTLGIVGKIPPKLNGASLTENADKITNISCDSDYLLYMLLSSPIQKIIESQKTLGAQPKLALNRIEKLQVTLPTNKREQQAIATILLDMDAEIVALEERREKTRALKQGMMQELLTGKTRLLP